MCNGKKRSFAQPKLLRPLERGSPLGAWVQGFGARVRKGRRGSSKTVVQYFSKRVLFRDLEREEKATAKVCVKRSAQERRYKGRDCLYRAFDLS